MEDENDFSSDPESLGPEEIENDFDLNSKPKTNASFGASQKKSKL